MVEFVKSFIIQTPCRHTIVQTPHHTGYIGYIDAERYPPEGLVVEVSEQNLLPPQTQLDVEIMPMSGV